MASDAEVDLVVNASRALSEVERDLDQIVRNAQANADPVNIATVMDRAASLATVSRQVDELVRRAEAGADDIDLNAAVATQTALRQVTNQLNRLVDEAERTGAVRPITLDAAVNAAASLPHINRDLRTIVRRAEGDADPVVLRVDVDIDEDSLRRYTRLTEQVRRGSISAARGVAVFSAGTVALGASLGSALPLIAGVVTAMESIVPAAAVGTTGILALALATNTVRLAMLGVEDAISDAFDPDVKPEDLEKQLQRLAPEARKFVRELVRMRSEFRGVQQAVQNQFFENFAAVARQLGRTVMPEVSRALQQTAGSFNEMIRRAAAAATALSESGVLGQALSGATRSIQNLRDVPAEAVTGFGALAAAAAPALDRITQRVAALSTRISEDLVERFRSGDLTAAIDEAFSNLAQLGRSAGNVLGGLRNIFRGLSADGETLFDRIEKVTGAFEDITGSSAFQSILGELASTAQTLGRNLAGILRPALEGVSGLFQALAPSVREVLDNLGPKIAGALRDLKPLFDGVGEAVGGFLEAASPLVELAIELAGLIGGALGPVFSTLGDIFRSLAPLIRQVADNFLAVARPILEQIGPAFDQVLPKFAEAADKIFPKIAEILAKLEPSFQKLGEAIAKLVPLFAEINAIIVDKLIAALEKLGPLLQPLIDKFIELASGALQLIAFTIETFVVPALEIVIDLLNGDFRSAGLKTIQLGRDVDRFLTASFNSLKENVTNALRTLGNNIVNAFNSALNQARDAVNRKLAEITSFFRNLPGRIQSALGNLGDTLFNAGSAIVEGMIRGVQAKVGSLLSQLADIARRAKDTVTSVLGIASPSKEFAKIGDFMVQGLQVGIARSSEALRRDLEGMALSMPRAVQSTPLTAGAATMPAPVVNVFLGNERFNGHVDARIQMNDQRRDRRIAQGGGRR